MSDVLDNAIKSLKLGIEDYQSNGDGRSISAVRNFYAGVLLLGKQCLLSAAPDADPMEVLASKFVPVPDGDGGVEYEPKGQRTIDLVELRERFKGFDLTWPGGKIQSLQKIRNEFEHYHSPAPKEAIRQAIADCFPTVQGFFDTLQLAPAELLGDTWEIMLSEESFFREQKSQCDTSFEKMTWHGLLGSDAGGECPDCGSSLIIQTDSTNDDPALIQGRCLACGGEMGAEKTVEAIVDGLYGAAGHIAAMEGDDGPVYDCTECWQHTYVADGDVNYCFFCDYSVSGECARCGDGLSIRNQSVNNSSLCDYCYHMSSKDD